MPVFNRSIYSSTFIFRHNLFPRRFFPRRFIYARRFVSFPAAQQGKRQKSRQQRAGPARSFWRTGIPRKFSFSGHGSTAGLAGFFISGGNQQLQHRRCLFPGGLHDGEQRMSIQPLCMAANAILVIM
ncbi:hypothetical protein GUJ93_ZPchr0015g6871 [Zizania palustris]|uniref:Uncharacterized protein n=1 Tax=Zizania palustris TaxID=103762 RepID=A0A8J5VSX8_ZIZPA|nr:hypothetical protein GUJ93_ZPchr0015g6871 [Zizania palustris]